MQTTWGKIILRAAQRGGFTERDKERSQEWPTCACGMLSVGIARDEDGRPYDSDLALAGGAFAQAVCLNRFVGAARSLCEIEARAAQVQTNSQPQGITWEESTDESTV
ncbi:MAG: hypothetical protein V3R76_00200 [Gammaproteobacteria bacterium]